MRIGLIGDIHGNEQALRSVLERIDELHCDRIVCTGDIVGYGPSPAECVREVRSRGIPCVMGNHENYVTLLGSPRFDRLRPDIQASLLWTQSVLEMDALRWLCSLPMRLELEQGMSLVHGSFGHNPWSYVVNPELADDSFAHQPGRLGVNGHCHIPLLCWKHPDQPAKVGFLRSSRLPVGARVLINPGSVGQPRDRDTRAAFAIYDTDADTVQAVRIPYDIAVTQRLMREAGLPEAHAERLRTAR
jgi:predicted phosphodiesterase